MTTLTDLALAESGVPHLPDLPALPPQVLAAHAGASTEDVQAETLARIRSAITDHPRSQQVRVGPSELGTPCARKLAYKLANAPAREREAAWRPTVGTAVHAWLAEVFVAANANTTPLRYAVEARVDVGEVDGVAITGSCDLFDRYTGTVVDWKVVGATTLTRVRTKGPSETYRRQAHLYGRGWQRRGQQVNRVAICYLPQSGELSDAVWWSEPYSEDVAVDALTRADAVAAGVRLMGWQDMVRRLPATEDYCTTCAYRKPASQDPAEGCPGAREPRVDQFRDLLGGKE